MTKQSQACLPGELLTSGQQYRTDVSHLFHLTEEEEPVYLERAQLGDKKARNMVIEGQLDYVGYWASRFFFLYSWESPRIEYLELVGVGNLALVEHFDEALTKDNPLAWLRATARWRMYNHCRRYRSLIATPKSEPAYSVESLDCPVSDDEETCFSDFLAVPEPSMWHSSLSINEERLYEAVARLGVKQQEVIKRLFGLDTHAPEQVIDIARKRGISKFGVQSLRDTALQALQRLLESPYQEVYTFRQACEVLGVCESQMYYIARKHHLTRVSKGHYPKVEIDALVSMQQYTAGCVAG